MGKRLAESQLTPDGLATQLKNEENGGAGGSQDEGKVDSAEVIGQRKIVRVKRHNQETGKVTAEQGKGTFKLAGSLSAATSSAPPAKPAAFPVFGAPAKKEEPEKKAADVEKKEEEKPKTGLFGDNSSKPFTFAAPTGPTLFAGQKVEESKPAAGSLFGSSAPATGGLFGSGVKFQPVKESLFAGEKIPGSTQSTSLFGNVSKPAAGSLFGSKPEGTTAAAPGSLFSGSSTVGSLFGAPAANGTSVFKTSGLFGNTAKTEENKNENEDSDGGVKDEDEAPVYAADADKVEFKSTYGQKVIANPYTKVFDKRVDVFKIVAPKTQLRKLTTGTLSIEWAEFNGKKVYLSVFRTGTLKALYTGQIDPKLSKTRRVEEKASKHQLKSALVSTDPATKQKTLNYIQINFSRHEEMELYEKEFASALSELKQ